MQPFDDGYVARREKRLQEMFVLQAITRTSALIAGVLTVAMIFVIPLEGFLALILGSIALAMWILVAFTWTIHRAQTSAEGAIQQEHQRLLSASGLAAEKPKRNTVVRLADDGELVTSEENPASTVSVNADHKGQRDHDSGAGI
jgi:type IV secretory pathway VirB3-like protein